jgi:outer membrane lipoprotein carrier protein
MKRIALCLLLCLPVSAVAWYESWDGIKKTAETIGTVKAEFTQMKHMKILSHPLVSKGTMYFKNPRSLRWEYRSPVTSVLMMSEGKVVRYVKGSGGFVKDSSTALQAMQVVVQEISRWMKGDFAGNPDLAATLKGGGTIVLTPKEQAFSKIIRRIELNLSKTPGIINSVKIIESESAYTLIKFEGVVINGPIDDSIFNKL